MKKFFYRVNKGDDLFSVCRKFNLSPLKVIYDNNLVEDILEGDLLYIEKSQFALYSAKPFDTLKSISQKFNVSEQRLKEINGNLPFVFYSLMVNVDC